MDWVGCFCPYSDQKQQRDKCAGQGLPPAELKLKGRSGGLDYVSCMELEKPTLHSGGIGLSRMLSSRF